MTETKTDCKTNEGVAVGLIDGIMSMANILSKMDLKTNATREAIKDLRQDKDLKKLLGCGGIAADLLNECSNGTPIDNSSKSLRLEQQPKDKDK